MIYFPERNSMVRMLRDFARTEGYVLNNTPFSSDCEETEFTFRKNNWCTRVVINWLNMNSIWRVFTDITNNVSREFSRYRVTEGYGGLVHNLGGDELHAIADKDITQMFPDRHIDYTLYAKQVKMYFNHHYGQLGILIPDIKNVVFNNPATIVFWADDTKTVVKAEKEDFDPEKGLAMAIARKVLGNKWDYYNTIKHWTKKYKGERDDKYTKISAVYEHLVKVFNDKKATKLDMAIAIEEAIGYLGQALEG